MSYAPDERRPPLLITDDRRGRWEQLIEVIERRAGVDHITRHVKLHAPVEFIPITINGERTDAP
jgi:hypothetical protein